MAVRPSLAAAALVALLSTAAAAVPEPPQVLFGELFTAVQTARIFPDSKTFADAVPTASPEEILRQYRRKVPRSPESLLAFVQAHFSLPPPASIPPAAAPTAESLVPHIDRLWDLLTRTTTVAPPYSSLLPLPQPYVVPGGRFREMYYWDSYFTMLGLMQSGRRDLVDDMVRNFASLIDAHGHVPNGTRTYYLSRSQPPFFFAMVELLNEDDPPAAFAKFLPQLKREHAFWMRDAAGLPQGAARSRAVALPDGSILNRYWDDRDTPRDEAYAEDTELARTSRREPQQLYRDLRAAAESGWDFGSRWFADGRQLRSIDTTELIPIDLNSLMYGLERAIAAGCTRMADAACAAQFTATALRRQTAIEHYLWDERLQAYADFRWTRRARVSRLSAASVFPLYVGLASAQRAVAVADTVARELRQPGGLATTPLDTGQQWDAPNGWAPLQWIAVVGLRRYGHQELAADIACRWIKGVDEVYERGGKLVEKYDVRGSGRLGGGGEYPTQDGFGWTNGVLRRLLVEYPNCLTPSRSANLVIAQRQETPAHP